jgi:hypothetical protein
MAATRAELSCPWTSLTRMPGGGPPLAADLGACASCASEACGAAAAIPAAFRNVRRFSFLSPRGG